MVCDVHNFAMMSMCCGAGLLSENGGGDIGLCAACRDWTNFICWDCEDEADVLAQSKSDGTQKAMF